MASASSVATEGSGEPVGAESSAEGKGSEGPAAPGVPEAVEPGAEVGDADEVVEGEVAPDENDPDRRVHVTAASFSGPLPPPQTLAEYEGVMPGLAREIVAQWKGETAHRHETITCLRETDRMAMQAFYQGERRGQYLSALVFVGVLGVAILAIVLHSAAVGIAALVSAGASAVWAMRRHSPGSNDEPKDLSDGDAIEKPSD